MEELNLTPVQALGVALSGVLGDTTMGECQEMAIGILENLKNLDFDIIKWIKPKFHTIKIGTENPPA